MAKETAQILQLRYPIKAGRWSDKQRILLMYDRKEITKETRDAWLKNGGHTE